MSNLNGIRRVLQEELQRREYDKAAIALYGALDWGLKAPENCDQRVRALYNRAEELLADDESVIPEHLRPKGPALERIFRLAELLCKAGETDDSITWEGLLEIQIKLTSIRLSAALGAPYNFEQGPRWQPTITSILVDQKAQRIRPFSLQTVRRRIESLGQEYYIRAKIQEYKSMGWNVERQEKDFAVMVKSFSGVM
jgi:hypothetical protein